MSNPLTGDNEIMERSHNYALSPQGTCSVMHIGMLLEMFQIDSQGEAPSHLKNDNLTASMSRLLLMNPGVMQSLVKRVNRNLENNLLQWRPP